MVTLGMLDASKLNKKLNRIVSGLLGLLLLVCAFCIWFSNAPQYHSGFNRQEAKGPALFASLVLVVLVGLFCIVAVALVVYVLYFMWKHYPISKKLLLKWIGIVLITIVSIVILLLVETGNTVNHR